MTISRCHELYNVLARARPPVSLQALCLQMWKLGHGKSISVILTLLMAILPLVSYFLILFRLKQAGFNC